MKKQISLLLVALGLSLSNGAQAGFYGPASRTTRQVTPFVSRYLARPGGLSQGAINAARTYARQPMQQQFSMPAARTFATKAPEIAARPNYSSWESMKKWLAGLLAGGTLIGTGSVLAQEESEVESESRFKAEQSLYFKNLLGQGVPEYVREFQTNRLLNTIRTNNDINEIRDALAKGADPSKGLISAVFNNDENVVKELLNAGANVNTRESYGSRLTPLMKAAYFSENPSIIEDLIKAGADVNAKDNLGLTALNHARERLWLLPSPNSSSISSILSIIRILKQADAKE